MRIGELEVEIAIDGQPAREYTDKDFEQEPLENHMSKYIEALSGSRFEFRCKAHPGYELAPAIDWLSFRCFIDGGLVRKETVLVRGVTSSKTRTATADGFISSRDGYEILERFRFDPLKTQGSCSPPLAKHFFHVLSARADGQITRADTVRQKELFSGIGQLKVEVWRKVGGRKGKKSKVLRGARDLSNIHEKAVAQKAVTIITKYFVP